MFVTDRANGEALVVATPVNPTLDILVRARALIARPENWVVGIRQYDLPGSLAYCALGAVDEAIASAPFDQTLYASSALRELARELPPDLSIEHQIAHCNNRGNHANALAMFDRAIARLQSQAM